MTVQVYSVRFDVQYISIHLVLVLLADNRLQIIVLRLHPPHVVGHLHQHLDVVQYQP